MESFSSLLRQLRYSESRVVEQLTESPGHDSSREVSEWWSDDAADEVPGRSR